MVEFFNLYKDIIVNSSHRIIGFGDKDITSKTYGCFDRTFWHYKLIDFPNARYQEAVLFLALLYENEFYGNIYYKNLNVLKWIESGISFWSKIQIYAGSFNEWYPFEHSFCATAMSTCAISEALIIIKKDISLKSLKKVGNWLMKNNNLLVANQMAASILALWNIYHITLEKKYFESCQEKILCLSKMRNESGYFLEYDGYDIGYSSILLSYLTKYYLKTNDQVIMGWIKRLFEFLNDKISKYGSYNFIETSRQTQYLFPFSFAVFNHDILYRFNYGLQNKKILSPLSMDDRYCIPFAIDFCDVLKHLLKEKNKK